jgi:heat shock protein HslJ
VRLAVSLTASVILGAVVGCATASAPTRSQADNSRTSLDWPGVYRGTVPCADCAGIRTRIELGSDGTYSRSRIYLGEDERPITDRGRFAWNEAGSRITLGTGRNAQQYQVGENVLFHLDRSGERITGDLAASYRLRKSVTDERIEDRRWQLVELNGRSIELAAGRDRPYLELEATEARATGNASCNRFFGSYELAAGNRIRFEPNIGATMMACPELELEREFLDALASVDNYTLGDGTLSLNRARMVPLARFRAADGGN